MPLSMKNEHKISAFIQRIYQASTQPDDWASILGDLASYFDASTGQMYSADFYRDGGPLSYHTPVDERCAADYLGHYVYHDPRMPVIRKNPGLAMTREMIVPTAEHRHSEIYNDFLVLWEVEQVVMMQVPDIGPELSFVAIMRSERAGPFGSEHRDVLELLLPHFQQSLRIYRQFAQLEQRNTALAGALELAPSGILVLDRSGRVIFANHLVQRIIDQRDGFGLARDGMPKAISVPGSVDLAVAIRAILTSGKGIEKHPGCVLCIPRPSMRRPYSVLVVPFENGGTVLGPKRAAVILMISDPETKPNIPADVLARLYNLTPAEARLAASFVKTTSLKKSAEVLGITEGTARQYLKRIFQKTDTKSQVELMKLMLSEPAAMLSR